MNPTGAGEMAHYVYCLSPVPVKEGVDLGNIGIEGSEVYSIGYKGLGAFIHDCQPSPYVVEQGGVPAAWVLAHHAVVDAVFKRYGTVLPLTFNTIIKADNGSARKNLEAWLDREYALLRGKIDALMEKAEYSIQLFWEPPVVARNVAAAIPEIAQLEEQIKATSPGVAFMYRQKRERLLKKQIETLLSEEFWRVYNGLSHLVDNIQIGKVTPGDGGQSHMLMNLSCLIATGKYADLVAELNHTDNGAGFSARLVGPLPPYSFC